MLPLDSALTPPSTATALTSMLVMLLLRSLLLLSSSSLLEAPAELELLPLPLVDADGRWHAL
jgi:hypothetical protein